METTDNNKPNPEQQPLVAKTIRVEQQDLLGSEDSRTPEVFDCPEVGFNMGAAREALRQR